ncbi:FKBP-type peptidyl-prolyl cis-trans isomerase [Shivajiella indica]|uniref:Peptidyl-prolyl cis-trans isomerase n=1 Tax=Shivajiella indica TaxID=872115 RepID=A0ABW5B4T1_9BACT
MRKVLGFMVVIATFGLGSCFEGLESDLEKAIERDDRLVKEYLERNNIQAIETPLGYYYVKEESASNSNQIVNNDIIGVYYEIKTINGQLIDSYLDETKDPKIFKHSEGGLVPRAMNFASGLAKEGEVFTLYVPSYLGYQDYSYQQLILPNSNLEIRIKYAKVYSEAEIKAIEEEMILNYLEEKELTGFERTEEGLYIKILNASNGGTPAEDGDIVGFTFTLNQLGETQPIAEGKNPTSPTQISLGSESNLEFLNLSMTGLTNNTEFEVLVPSHLAFGVSTQVFPFQVRRDLFQKAYIPQVARPFEPLLFKAKIVDIR